MGQIEAHRARRNAFMKTLGPRGAAVFPATRETLRNGDSHYAYRPASDLYYLTGFREPEAVLVLRSGAADERVVLFVRPRDPEREIWDGRRAGVDGALSEYGADAAYPIAELDDRLPALIANVDELHVSLGVDADFDAKLCSMIATLRQRERRGLRAPRSIVDPRTSLHEQRLIKDADEVSTLRRAAAITGEAHIAAMRAAQPGMNERELEALVDYTFRRRGGTGAGYTSIVGAGDNATILHYIENDQPLHDGDLVLIDAGCEYDFYTADVTRTFPVGGRFSPAQRQIYELVLSVQKNAIAMTRPGATIDQIHDRCVEELTAGMVELGLLEGPASARIEDGTYKRYYMHRTSHWLGLDVHDVGAYTVEGEARPLVAGMVITIEPGLYVGRDDEQAPERFRGIGVRIEDDLLVTESGCENLTSDIPKEVTEVEAACGRS